MKRFLLLSLTLSVIIASCSYDEIEESDVLEYTLTEAVKDASPDGTMSHYILPSNHDIREIPQDPANKLNNAKIQLGKFLFFETGIGMEANKPSGLRTYSCATCHLPTSGLKPGREQGIADGGIGFGINGEGRTINPEYEVSEVDVQGIRPLALFNVAYVENTLWNGQFGSSHVNEGTEELWNEEDLTDINATGLMALEAQNIKGLELHRMMMTPELAEKLGYKDLFDLAFQEKSEDERYTTINASFAISAYLRSIVTNKAPFQEWLKGNSYALTEDQKKGGVLFFGKAGCGNCHKNKNLGHTSFHALGVKDLFECEGVIGTGPEDKKNLGRGGFTKKEEDMFKFKVPGLYNLKNAPFYFHGASKYSLDDVLEYFNNGIPENPRVPEEQISPLFRPLNLTDEELADLKDFIENGLYDPDIKRYVPSALPSGNCFPNADPVSKADMLCE